jgi:hypothetical protein
MPKLKEVPFNAKDAMKLAKEWATEMQAIEAPQFMIAEEFAKGFKEVELGRHPRTVLKETVDRIKERVAERKKIEGQNEA